MFTAVDVCSSLVLPLVWGVGAGNGIRNAWPGSLKGFRMKTMNVFAYASPSPVLLCCSLTETLGEVKSLDGMLSNRLDIKVITGTWRWSSTSPWPPISSVLKCPLWRLDEYQDIRERLKRPAPEVSITTGGEFITIDTRSKPKAPAADKDTGAGESGADEGTTEAALGDESQVRLSPRSGHTPMGRRVISPLAVSVCPTGGVTVAGIWGEAAAQRGIAAPVPDGPRLPSAQGSPGAAVRVHSGGTV